MKCRFKPFIAIWSRTAKSLSHTLTWSASALHYAYISKCQGLGHPEVNGSMVSHLTSNLLEQRSIVLLLSCFHLIGKMPTFKSFWRFQFEVGKLEGKFYPLLQGQTIPWILKLIPYSENEVTLNYEQMWKIWRTWWRDWLGWTDGRMGIWRMDITDLTNVLS